MPASSRILSCNHGILSSTSYLPAARFCFPQEAPLFVENRSDSFQAIPHNSKCRYGERGAADAKSKAQIILDAAKVSAASGGNSEPKQGQRSQSARGFCPRSTMRVPQPDIIEYFGNVDAVPQLPERCLSHKAGIVRCCLKDTAPAHACQIPLAIWTGVWDNGLQQKAMPFAPGRIDRRNGGTGTPPDFSPKGGCFLC